MLELDLKQADQLDGQASGASDAHGAVLVGRVDLLDVALRDDVAHRGAAVPGHEDAFVISQRHDGGAVWRIEFGAAHRMRWRRPWYQRRRVVCEKVSERRAAGPQKCRRQRVRLATMSVRALASRCVTPRPSGRMP